MDLCSENIMVKDCDFILENDGYLTINPEISLKLVDFGVLMRLFSLVLYINLTDIAYLKRVLPPTIEPEFYRYLQSLDTHDVSIYAIDEGNVVFPKVPLLRLEGPLPIVQLLETTLLTLINYARFALINYAMFCFRYICKFVL